MLRFVALVRMYLKLVDFGREKRKVGHSARH